MARWRFWEKEEHADPGPPPAEPPQFKIRPRTDLNPSAAASDPALAAAHDRLVKRRAGILLDVEQTEAATRPANPWLDRVREIDDALAAVAREQAAVSAEPRSAGAPIPATPIDDIRVATTAPPSVGFRIGPEAFVFEEDLDWSERGFQLARSDLQLRSGSVANLPLAILPPSEREAAASHLANSLFVFASDMLDRALSDRALPERATLADLAVPSPNHGGWLDWHGASPEHHRRERLRQELEVEAERLRTERARELEERARWADRLPIARRRLADVDAELAKLGATP